MLGFWSHCWSAPVQLKSQKFPLSTRMLWMQKPTHPSFQMVLQRLQTLLTLRWKWMEILTSLLIPRHKMLLIQRRKFRPMLLQIRA